MIFIYCSHNHSSEMSYENAEATKAVSSLQYSVIRATTPGGSDT